MSGWQEKIGKIILEGEAPVADGRSLTRIPFRQGNEFQRYRRGDFIGIRPRMLSDWLRSKRSKRLPGPDGK